MAQLFKFLNSAPGDPREYQAADFADYFGSVLTTGLIHTNKHPGMEVFAEGGNLRTYITAGKAIMKGHLYENTTNEILEHSLPESTFDRIDRIVLRLNLHNSERNILLHVKEGAPSEAPVAPELQRDNYIYELSLARIRVRGNTTTLRADDLVDERLNEGVCGLVNSMLTVPTSQFLSEWEIFMDGLKNDGFLPVPIFNQEKGVLEKGIQANSQVYDLFTNGYFAGFGGGLEVAFGTSKAVSVSAGKALIDGVVFEHDGRSGFGIDTYERGTYVRIVVGCSSEGIITMYKKERDYEPPQLQRDENLYELSLALISPSSVSTLAYEVTDERNDNYLCGVARPIINTKWRDLPLLNGAIPYNNDTAKPQYCKIGDIVYLRGSVKLGTTHRDIVVGNLPEGFRPVGQNYPFIQNASQISGVVNYNRWEIQSNGNVRLYNSSVATASLAYWHPLNTSFPCF